MRRLLVTLSQPPKPHRYAARNGRTVGSGLDRRHNPPPTTTYCLTIDGGFSLFGSTTHGCAEAGGAITTSSRTALQPATPRHVRHMTPLHQTLRLQSGCSREHCAKSLPPQPLRRSTGLGACSSRGPAVFVFADATDQSSKLSLLNWKSSQTRTPQ